MESYERVHSQYLFSVLDLMEHGLKKDLRYTAEGLLNLLKEGGSYRGEEILQGFPKVDSRTKNYAEREGIEMDSVEAAEGYWLVEHNRLIDDKIEEYNEMPETQKENCKTRLGKVIRVLERTENVKGIRDTSKLEIECSDGVTRQVIDFIYGGLGIGDYVSTHQGLVSRKLSLEKYEYYKELRRE